MTIHLVSVLGDRFAVCGARAHHAVRETAAGAVTCGGCRAWAIARDVFQAPHRTSSTFPQSIHSTSNSQKPPLEATQMPEMSKKGEGAPGSIPGGVTLSSVENSSGSGTAPEQPAVETHTGARPAVRLPAAGEVVEVLPEELFRHGQGTSPAWVRARVEDAGESSFLADVDGVPYVRSYGEFGRLWRWPEAGAVRAEAAPGEGLGRCEVCGWPLRATIDEGCVLGNCSYRPEVGSDEYRRIQARKGEGLPSGVRCPNGCDPEWLTALARGRWKCGVCGLASGADELRRQEGEGLRPRCASVGPDDVICELDRGHAGRHEYDGVVWPAAAAVPGEGLDRLVSEGGAGRFRWTLKYLGAAKCFAGQLFDTSTEPAMFVTGYSGSSSEAVMQALLAKVDDMVDPRDTRYVPPAVVSLGKEDPRLAKVATLLGLGAFDRHLAQIIDDAAFTAQRRRRAAVSAVLDWVESSRREIEAAPALDSLTTVQMESLRALWDRQVRVLFETIGGAL